MVDFPAAGAAVEVEEGGNPPLKKESLANKNSLKRKTELIWIF